ncbi:hypothetical protein H6G21_21865 [Alkalinema sp. FACHB-956]|nr:hypothetical protein [Alkalinema sp. FACHB-956]
MFMQIAYLTQGKLFLTTHNAQPKEIESEFGQTVQVRSLQIQRQKAWKNRGIMEMMMPPAAVTQMKNQPEATIPIAITSLCQGQDQTLLYALEAGDVGGIFRFDPSCDRELRLFHNADFRVGHLDYQPELGLIACTTTYATGISNIATMAIDGNRPRDITEGDSLDLAPRWIPGAGKALVYQSAGLGRTADGYVGDRAPFTIEKLDFKQGDITTLAADPKADLLSPQIGVDGLLYYIRRPYKARHSGFNPLKVLKEILLIPVRLLYAIFQWLNFFTQMYTGKPLMRAGTHQKVEPKMLKAWGEWITPEQLKDKNFGDADAPSLVPRTWQLVRQPQQGVGNPEVIAEGVLAFDLAPDGTIVFTNGSAIYRIDPQGQRSRLLVANWIESVTALSALPN